MLAYQANTCTLNALYLSVQVPVVSKLHDMLKKINFYINEYESFAFIREGIPT